MIFSSIRSLPKFLLFLLCAMFLVFRASAAQSKEAPLSFTAEEKQWLEDHPKLRVGVGIAFPPFMWVDDEDGRPVFKGIVSDYLGILKEKLDVELQIIQDIPFDHALAEAKAGRIDFFPCISRSPERSKFLLFTKPYISYPFVIVTRENAKAVSSVNDLAGKRIAVVKHLVVFSKLRNEFPDLAIDYHFTGKVEENLEAVSFNLADACIINLAVASYLIQEKGLTNLRIGATLDWDSARYSAGVRNDQPILKDILEKALASIPQSEKDRISQRWINAKYEPGVDVGLVWKWSLGLGLGIGLVFLFVFRSNKRLKNEIFEKEMAEKALRKTEAMQRKMVSNIGDVIVIIDQEGINKYNSPNIEKLFGWKPDEVIGSSAWDNVHPDDLEFAKRFFDDIIRTPDAVGTIECRFKCRNGIYKWIEFSGNNLLHDSDIGGVLGNYKDITERKLSEQTLRESEARFKALHNASFGGIAIHDKGVILECNQGLSVMSGYSEAELIGMDGLLLIAEQSRAFVMGNILSGYEKPYEAMGLRKNGEEFPMRLEARNIPYKGKMVRTVEFRDISEQKQAEKERQKLQAQLTQAQKMESVGRLAGGVAHDFNNMLSVILGYAEMALEQVDPGHPLHAGLREIQKAGRRSADITRQLLAFARKQTIAPKVLDLNTTVEGMLKMLRRLIGEDIDLAWQPAASLWPVRMDPSQVDQILANLCVNARDAIEGVGRITIQTNKVALLEADCRNRLDFVPGDFVLLSVGDDGCGMAPQTLANLFEPFFTTKDVDKGTGLGLATVYGIVKQNNGFISVESRPGRGSTFRIYLPRHESAAAPVLAKDPAAPDRRGVETILLVEDEPSILRMTTAMLQRLDYRILTAANPEQAVALAEAHTEKIHLLITDVVMPDMNGSELSSRLRAMHPEIKVLFMSGYTADVIAHHGVLQKGMHFIQKPFSKKDLANKVRETLEAAHGADADSRPQ